MQLFYAPDITPPLYTLSDEESKHCVRVLRLSVGDELHITDGKGNEAEAQIQQNRTDQEDAVAAQRALLAQQLAQNQTS